MARWSIVTLLFAVAAAGATRKECFVEHGARIAESSECANEEILLDCLSQIQGYERKHLRECYEEAGCSLENAKREAKLTIRLCKELTTDEELRRRAPQNNDNSATNTASSTAKESATQGSTAKESSSAAQSSSSARASSTEATTTTVASSTKATSTTSTTSSASAASSTTLVSSTTFTSTTASSSATTSNSAQTGDVRSGDACFSTSDKSTKLCDVTTSAGRQRTQSCSSTTIKASSCYDNMLCTTNTNGDDICMILHGIDSGGIAIATIIAVASAALIVGVFTASMMESKRQKRAAAKAAALAITRSATMKKRQLDAAAPAS